MTIFSADESMVRHSTDQDKALNPEETKIKAEEVLTKWHGDSVRVIDRSPIIPGSYSAEVHAGWAFGSGKGLTASQARASAAMECIERLSWLDFDYENDPNYRYASYNDLQAEGLPLVPESYFFMNFTARAEKNPLFDTYLEDLKNVPLRWLPAKSLNDESVCYYPFNYHSSLFSSNGLAAGNNLIEAATQAVCELIERENIRQLYLNGRPGRLIEKSTITSPYARDFLDAAQKLGITFDLLEISGPMGIPTIIARGHDLNQEGKILEWGLGQGTHLEVERAINRALSEYAEGRAIMVAAEEKMRMDLSLFNEQFGRQHMGFLNFVNPENFLASGEPLAVSAVKSWHLDDFKEKLSVLIKAAESAGHKLYYYDITHKDLKIPALRLFSPTMGSIINTPFENPEGTLASVYNEGGRPKEAIRYLMADLNKNQKLKELTKMPMVAIMLPSILAMLPKEQLFGADYRAALKERGKIKQSGLNYLNDKLSNLTAVLKNQAGL